MSSIAARVEKALSLSKADHCVVIGSEDSTANVRWANNTSTTNGLAANSRLHVVSVIDGRVGSFGLTNPGDDQLEEAVRRAEAACEGRPAAEDALPLPGPEGDPAGWDDPVDTPGIDVFARFAPALGDAFGQAEGDGVRLFGYAEHVTSTTWLASSTGLRRRDTRGDGRLEINAKSPDFSRSTWVGRTTDTFADVDVPGLYDHLTTRLGWSATTLDRPAGHYEVILEPSAVGDMAYFLYMSSAARDADEGRTVFSRPGGGNRIGERMYAPGISLYSDPAEPVQETTPFLVTTASSSFASVFDNGLALGRTSWVRDGVQEALVTTRHWAARNGGAVTPYVDNLVLPSTGPSLDEMIASTTGPALLVTCFWYMREVEPQTLLVTGLTRDGVFLVEGGEVRGAVNNFRFNMSPVDLLAQATELGTTTPTRPREFGDYFQRISTPPMRVDGFHMSSVSQAR